MPTFSNKKSVDPVMVEYKREEIENLIRNDAHNQISARPSNIKKKYRFVSAESDNFGGLKILFIPIDD